MITMWRTTWAGKLGNVEAGAGARLEACRLVEGCLAAAECLEEDEECAGDGREGGGAGHVEWSGRVRLAMDVNERESIL